MASTKRVNVAPIEPIKPTTPEIIKEEIPVSEPVEEIKEKVIVENKKNTVENYDFIRPSHYVQEDGRETWEHMLDIWTVEEVALWCEMTAYKYKDRIGRKPGENIEREQAKIDWYENKAKELRNQIPAKKKKFSFWKK